MIKFIFFLMLAAVASSAISDMSLRHFGMLGLIVAIPFTIYAGRLVFTLARETLA